MRSCAARFLPSHPTGVEAEAGTGRDTVLVSWGHWNEHCHLGDLKTQQTLLSPWVGLLLLLALLALWPHRLSLPPSSQGLPSSTSQSPRAFLLGGLSWWAEVYPRSRVIASVSQGYMNL